MGVHFPFVAWLTDAMVLPVGDPVPQGRLIHPRIEPEIVFVMGERLEGPGVTCAQAMADLIASVLPGGAGWNDLPIDPLDGDQLSVEHIYAGACRHFGLGLRPAAAFGFVTCYSGGQSKPPQRPQYLACDCQCSRALACANRLACQAGQSTAAARTLTVSAGVKPARSSGKAKYA